ncbi:MAG TPA: hypothetical protein ENK85_02560 [Saprospiraceae bacterium]|nr:hypothetical protein [Saprospiraceae bacterium]
MSRIPLILLIFIPYWLAAQVTDSIASRVVLDTEVVVAAKKGFDIKKFIEIVQADSVFAQAFHRLRSVPYQSSNEFHFFSRKGREVAGYKSEIIQKKVDSLCMVMTILSEKATGNYYKRKGKHRYYTAKMFERLFYKKGKHCPKPKPVTPPQHTRMENYVQQLKKLIYNPGKEVKIPLIGHKTAIFDEKMIKYYDFKIQSRRYKDETPCYVFTAIAKPNRPNKTVIKYLEMWLDKAELGIISKKYHLKTTNLAFNFDIKMDVDLIETPLGILPSKIDYDGSWKAPMKRKEISKFLLLFNFDSGAILEPKLKSDN